jgi:competence protein ComEC
MPHLRLLAVGWALGIALAVACEGHSVLGLRCGASAVAIVALLLFAAGARRLSILLLSFAVAALVSSPTGHASPELFDDKPWSLLGMVDGAPRRQSEGLTFALALERAGPVLPDRAAAGRLRLRSPPPREAIGPGDLVLSRGRVLAPGRRCNFGACDGAWRAAADGVDGSTFVADRAQLVRADRTAVGAQAWLWALREAMRARIELRLPTAEAALVAALVVGERGGVGPEEEARFRAAGVTHLLSVSGLHLAFAAGLLFAAVRALLRRLVPLLAVRRPRDRWAALLSLPIVAAYAILTGAEVATVRAALVVGHAFVGLLCTQRVRAGDALAFAALAILVARPASLLDPSFQLSFVAAWATMASAWRPARRTGLAWLAGRAGQVLSASLAATVATAPITAAHFSQIAPVGAISNLVAIPLTEAAIVPLGIVGALADLFWPTLGGILLSLAGALAALLRALVAALAAVAPVWIVPAPSTLLLGSCALALLWVARSPGLKRVACASAFVAVVVAAEALWDWGHPRLELTVLDVGQGDAIVLRLPDGRAILVDGGGGGRADPGAQVVVPALLRLGVRRLALVVLSHGHPDHAGGLAEVLRRLPVDELWDNGRTSDEPSVRALRAVAAARGVQRGPPRAQNFGGVLLDVLAAHGEVADDPLASENDASLVLRIRWAGRTILLTGDIEEEAERALVAEAPGPTDILKVPHHGSRTSSTAALLEALRPRWAIASLAAGNRYRFPHPDVVARYRAGGAALLRTDRDGAVQVRIFADGEMKVRCARPSGCGAEPTMSEGPAPAL